MVLPPRILAEIDRLMRDPNALSNSQSTQQRHRYDPTQPPSGNPHGGRWTRLGLFRPAARPGSRTGPTDNIAVSPSIIDLADEQAPLVSVAERRTRPRRPHLLEMADAAKLALYEELSARNNPGQRAILEFRGWEFGRTKIDVERVRIVDRKEMSDLCPLYETVQDWTTKAAARVKQEHPHFSPQQFGTAVHKIVADEIRRLNDPRLKAEMSLIKSTIEANEAGPATLGAHYGKLGTIRYDAFEVTDRPDTVCIHDLKTGRRGLSLAHMHEMAWNARQLHKTNFTRFIVNEVRP